jgi:outer membrane protein OmpA-like peptidoglycan-associated protein
MPTAMSNRMGYLHGGSTSVAYNFNRYLGLVADFGGYDDSRITLFSPTGSQTLNSSGSAYTYTFGPRFSYRRYQRFTPFAQALFGGTYATSVTISGCTGSPACTPLGSDNAFATMLGVGFDVKISRHIALRPFEGDFLLTNFKNPFSAGGQARGWQDNARFSAGIVFRFGSMGSAPTPAAAVCSAEPAEVFAGEPVTGTANGSDFNPKRGIQYAWTGTGVGAAGSNASTRIDTTGLQPGSYQVTANLSDGSKNGVASCIARFNVKQPRPPEVACSSNPGTVTTGDSATIRSNASSPDNRRLSYSYSASAGNVSGAEATATLNTAGAPPGAIRVTCNVSDDRMPALTASAATIVTVEAPPPPPPPPPPQQPTALELRLALHSIYFQTALPTARNPAGGLLDSQQQTLISLARDFNEYVAIRPDAHLILEGHADPRGSAEYNQALTERRVERTKSFLIEHGVPAANVEIKAFGDQQNLTDDQVKDAVERNPELSAEDRQRILKNMRVVILASNRRADVVLSTTGQQSVRQYPFNARDSLTLLSTKGVESEKQTKTPARKKTTQP